MLMLIVLNKNINMPNPENQPFTSTPFSEGAAQGMSLSSNVILHHLDAPSQQTTDRFATTPHLLDPMSGVEPAADGTHVLSWKGDKSFHIDQNGKPI